MLCKFAQKWLKPPALSRTDSSSTLIMTECEKYPELHYPSLPCERTRPDWMTHGFEPCASPERAENFPDFPVFDTAEHEEAAMRAVHAQAGLLKPAHPFFVPDLTPINGMSAARASYKQENDVFIHAAEAHDALRSSLHFAAGKARSRYQHSHPAFARPDIPWRLYSSPLAGEMLKCIENTFKGCRNSIRVAPPSQIRLELETCLAVALAPYLLSKSFRNARGESTIVPEALVSFLEEESRFGPCAMRDVIACYEEGLVEGGDNLLRIWAAWRWVVKVYVGTLVLRHKQRPNEEVMWS